MRRVLVHGLTVVLVVLGTARLSAQVPERRIYSTPTIPSDTALRRLNLRLAWRAVVPMDGQRDALLRVKVVGPDLLVLTRSGLIVRIDAETGIIHWRARVDKPYTTLPYLTANSRSVFVIANAHLYSLNRDNGGTRWSFPLTGGISAAPTVDEGQIYLSTAGTKLLAYALPAADTLSNAGPSVSISGAGSLAKLELLIRPLLRWAEQTNIELSYPPVQSVNRVFTIGPDGSGRVYSKIREEGQASGELFRFSTSGRVNVRPVAYGDTAYIGSDDAILYALDLNSGKNRWRYTAGTAIISPPVVIADDVYVTSEKEGLARVDSETGEALWRIPRGGVYQSAVSEADQFLAANSRFVYATDFSNRLLVLDKKRGRRLSMLDTSAFRVPVVNPVTDRLYLAANNGLIICLHDRDQPRPLRHLRQLEEQLRARLDQKITEQARRLSPLREVLAYLNSKYGVQFKVAERAFREAGIPNPQEINVAPPKADNKPLKEYLQSILTPARATFDIVDDTLLIIPGKPPEKK